VIHGGSPGLAKAGRDTINLMAASDDPTNNVDPRDGGLEPYYDGDFEDALGHPDWNGWTHHDITAPTTSHWNVSTYNQPDPNNHAAWCGDIDIPSCEAGDPDGGYGNNWNDILEFRQAVPYPELGSTVSVTASMIHDSEAGYDYVYLSYQYEGQNIFNMQMWDGAGTVAVSNSVSYLPTEYIGGTEIAVYFRFWSDGAWSDEDCMLSSVGACQIDDINVNIVNGSFDGNFFEDFEHGGDPDDFGIWAPVIPHGVGDFAHIWTGLEDNDPCATNYTPQVAFIDDGIVVPGTGGSECINWCYGPGGYIVTTSGGLAGPSYHIHNAIESPVMDWPASKTGNPVDDDGITLTFSVFRHEDLSADSPGIFYTWGVRSADTDGSAGTVQDITNMGWQNRNYVYYGGPDYLRDGDDVTDLMNPGRDVVQVQLAVYEIGYVWGWVQNDGYPAPYFDNVTVKIFPYYGPGMSAREIDLAQDNFPARGTIDYGDLGSHSVRFDMANNISLAAHLRNDPGDSITVDITPVRAGADFVGFPTLHYILDRNPIFDAFRTAGLPDMGFAVGDSAVGPAGSPTPGKWAFDLPDTGFLFPGDVLHYYISATDAVGGANYQTALMPADTTGFSTGFGTGSGYPLQYNPAFTVRALPSIREKYAGFGQPEVLFINDFASRGGEDEWYTSLYNCGLQMGETYDVFHVNGPTSGVGNGIGGRANHLMLADYSVILYTSGDLGVNTIANGDFNLDPGDDVGTLINWLDIGDKKIFLTGDNLASDLAGAGIATGNFLENYMGLTLVANNVRDLISNQTAPFVNTTNPPEVFQLVSSWIAYGACPGINTFDGVRTRGTATRLAEFTEPGGQQGIWPYSAATLNWVDTSRIISMPVDFSFIHSDRNNKPPDWLPFPDRTLILWDVLTYFGIPLIPTDTPAELPRFTFMVSNYPNPFNPGTTIRYAMPRAGHLKLSVYNVRGHLVKTLIDGDRPAGENQTIFWDGSNNLGSAAASGVYFYEARAAGEVKIGKMTLLK
jgi:hypothetical protein